MCVIRQVRTPKIQARQQPYLESKYGMADDQDLQTTRRVTTSTGSKPAAQVELRPEVEVRSGA